MNSRVPIRLEWDDPKGRRCSADAHTRVVNPYGCMVVLVPGFLEFVKLLDGVLKEMASREELVTGIHPQALRSALMGAVEGLLRDQLLARTSRFPASYSEADMRAIFAHFLSSCVNQ